MSIEDFIISNELTIFDKNHISQALKAITCVGGSYTKLTISGGRCLKISPNSCEIIQCEGKENT